MERISHDDEVYGNTLTPVQLAQLQLESETNEKTINNSSADYSAVLRSY